MAPLILASATGWRLSPGRGP